VFRIYAAEICAVRPQFAKERLFIFVHALPNDRDSESLNRRGFSRNGRVQSICIRRCRGAKRVELMSGPKMRGKLFHKLRWLIHPVDMFELGRKSDLSEWFVPHIRLI